MARTHLKEKHMQYLHTMVRVRDLEQSLEFYCKKLGLVEISRDDYEKARYTLVFLAAREDRERAKEDKTPVLELTYNWPDAYGHREEYTGGRNFGHLAFRVDDIYATCEHLMNEGITINRPPRDGYMAFIKSPDGISIELLQKGERLQPQKPWTTMENVGSW